MLTDMQFNLPMPEALQPLAQNLDKIGRDFIIFLAPVVGTVPEEKIATYGWPLVRFSEALYVVALYLAFVFIGTFIMKSIYGSEEKQDNDKRSIAVILLTSPIRLMQAIYNPLQVALCGYMMTTAALIAREQGYNFLCNKFELTDPSMASIVWVFYMSKVLDFMDTFFIIMRCKWRQLSFLHVYHHASIFLVYWININGGFDGEVYYTVVLNSFIHFVMYFYYFVRTFKIPVPMWLKAMVTKAQMIQFVTMNIQAIYVLATGCGGYPRGIIWMYLGYVMTMFMLFENFRRATYNKAAKGKGKKKSE